MHVKLRNLDTQWCTSVDHYTHANICVSLIRASIDFDALWFHRSSWFPVSPNHVWANHGVGTARELSLWLHVEICRIISAARFTNSTIPRQGEFQVKQKVNCSLNNSAVAVREDLRHSGTSVDLILHCKRSKQCTWTAALPPQNSLVIPLDRCVDGSGSGEFRMRVLFTS